MHQTLASLLLPHLFDDALVGIALVAVILLFAGSVIVAIVASIKPTLAPGSANFTYVATVVAGLVLSVASGVLGEPAKAEVSASSGLTAPSSPQQQTVEMNRGCANRSFSYAVRLELRHLRIGLPACIHHSHS